MDGLEKWTVITKKPNLKKNIFRFWGEGGLGMLREGRKGARINEFFLLKIKI